LPQVLIHGHTTITPPFGIKIQKLGNKQITSFEQIKYSSSAAHIRQQLARPLAACTQPKRAAYTLPYSLLCQLAKMQIIPLELNQFIIP
jgi:hypothetical protein